MSYQLEIGTDICTIKGDYFPAGLTEVHTDIKSDGFAMHLREVSSPNFHLIWGNYNADKENKMSIKFDTPSVVSHFCLSNSSVTAHKKNHLTPSKQFSLYHQKARMYTHEVAVTAKEQGYNFFELTLSNDFFEKLHTAESEFLHTFYEKVYKNTDPDVVYNRITTPPMLSLINEMSRNDYSSYLKNLYLEAKAVELFLLQVNELDQKTTVNSTKLKSADVEALHAAKNYIEQNYLTPCSIIDLAKIVGINQMKLKDGFKDLFGTTVFGYLKDLQMEEAHHLLLEEKLYVGEVADRLGYKHAHHFAAAFKRKFGILPGELKG